MWHFFQQKFNLERHLTTCSEWVKNVYPKNAYQIREILFDKSDSLGIKYTSQQKLFKNLAIFDFELICVPEESFNDTKTTTWIGKHVPISVSNSSNRLEKPIFVCNSDPHQLFESFIEALENLASQCKAKMKNLFLDIRTTIRIKLCSILEKLTQRHNRRESARFDMSQDDSDNEICASTHFLQIRRNQLIEVQESLDRYCNVLTVFGFNSAKYDPKLIKAYLLPILVNERDIEPTLVKKANQIHLIQIWWYSVIGYNELSWRSNKLWFILEGIQNFWDKSIFPYEWFDHPDKMQNTELSPIRSLLQ